ncbi:uncharacterized protein LOC134189578 isoform X2 [Corticium candelabrum]|uniref:uncharacterized protein LOC134189578 isoform X2 n=1 Tax=Corticium candelabrum TaxID=121492 RepID=UPI002E268136|nr:uncharacterized protein LOC134189578 isoform X2 [Corticium candelabrum]
MAKVDVCLTWNDFFWSLQKLSHSPYSRDAQEKDWFRINPLEIVLLGCESLGVEQECQRQMATITVGMTNITTEMSSRPRLWLKLIDILTLTFSSANCPAGIQQRVLMALKHIYDAANRIDRIRVAVISHLVTCVLPGLETVSQETSVILSPVGTFVSKMVSELRSMLSNCSLHFAPRPSARQPLILRLQNMPSSRQNQQDLNDAQLHIYMYAKHHGFESISTYLEHLDSAISLMTIFNSCELSSTKPLHCLLYILNCFESLGKEHRQHDVVSQLLSLFIACCEKWMSITGTKSDLPNKIIELCFVLLAAHENDTGLQLAINLLGNPFDILVSYSTEGYLSSNSPEMLRSLLELITVGVETGVSPMEMMTSFLANLFGPLFGARDHRISRALIEYGILSLCSSHRNILIEKGLHFMGKLYHLFPPIDAVVAQRHAACRRAEAISVASNIMDDVMNSAPFLALDSGCSVEKSSIEMIAKQLVTDVIYKATRLFKHDQGWELVKLPVATVSFNEVIAYPSDLDREIDRQLRMDITVELLHLACAIIRRGDDISFLYGNVLPKLLQPQPETVLPHATRHTAMKLFGEDPLITSVVGCWTHDYKLFALELLKLATVCVSKNVCSPFLVCAIAVPKLVSNIGRLALRREEKLKVIMEVLHIARDGLNAGQHIEDFITHGIDFLSRLLPETGNSEELKTFVADMAHCFIRSSQSSVLFLAKSSCEFMLHHFSAEEKHIQALFRVLIQRGRRDDIRSIFRMCKEPFIDPAYTAIRSFIYEYSTGGINSKQLQALCEILQLVFTLMGPQANHRGRDDIAQDSNLQMEKAKQEVLLTITGNLMDELVSHLQHKTFTRDVWEHVNKQLSHVILFKTLYGEELAELTDKTQHNVLKIFDSKFAPDVISSHELMTTLSQCATRLETMQLPRYDELKRLLIRILNYFLVCNVNETLVVDESTDNLKILRQRRFSLLESYLLNLPRNSEDRELLIKHGYSRRCWEQPCRITVTTDGCRSLEENMRQALLAYYTEYIELLKSLGVAQISVDGEIVVVDRLFDETLPLSHLKGRRAIAVRMIDSHVSSAFSSRALDRKITLLAEEDRIETEFESQPLDPVEPKTFTAMLHSSFFDCARCCGPKLVGCYVPTGEHSERPLEIGMRQDSGFLSIYDEKGEEIENCEIVFADEGVYVYKAYSNGHPYDTSKVWVSMFEALLKGSDSYVPAVIVPMYHPNVQTWNIIKRIVDTEMTGSELTFRFDFSSEWKSYYDYRPERIRCGSDVVLHPGFSVNESSRERRMLIRQKSRLTKDLAGEIFDVIIQGMLKHDWLKRFRFLGKHIAQFVSYMVNHGSANNAILLNGFDYDRWKRTQKTEKVASKKEIVEQLSDYVVREVMSYHVRVEVVGLFAESRKRFFEMKSFIEKLLHRVSNFGLQRKYKEMLAVLQASTQVVPICDLPAALAEELIHFIFRNEDRVWRYRGGRDGYETLQQYMGFLGRTTNAESGGLSVCVSKPQAFAGMAVFCVPSGFYSDYNYRVEDVIAYAVGEYVPLVETDVELPSEFAYEVVTAWVHPRFRSLSLSIQMYCGIMENAETSFLLCDTVLGSFEHIVASNRLFRLLVRLRLLSYILRKREESYEVITQDGQREKFEKLTICTTPVVTAFKVHHWLNRVSRVCCCKSVWLSALPVIAVGAWILCKHR